MSSGWCVVVPSDNEENLHASSSSVLTRHPGLDPSAIMVVSRTLDPRMVREPLRKLTYVEDHGEFNFARSVNLGFAAAGDLDVVVMGDDIELATDCGFDRLREEAPLRLLAGSVRGRIGPWWQREGQEHPEVPFVSFTCVYVPRTVWRIVGPMDEGFPGYGYDDTDYCLRARRHGLSCGVSGKVVVEHNVRLASSFISTYKEKIVEMEIMARKAFEEKWRSRLL